MAGLPRPRPLFTGGPGQHPRPRSGEAVSSGRICDPTCRIAAPESTGHEAASSHDDRPPPTCCGERTRPRLLEGRRPFLCGHSSARQTVAIHASLAGGDAHQIYTIVRLVVAIHASAAAAAVLGIEQEAREAYRRVFHSGGVAPAPPSGARREQFGSSALGRGPLRESAAADDRGTARSGLIPNRMALVGLPIRRRPRPSSCRSGF